MVLSFGSDVGILHFRYYIIVLQQTQSQNFETLFEFKDKLHFKPTNFHAIFGLKA
jgi:hypothetical protein